MKYAVIKLMGHQYKVSEGDVIFTDKLSDEKVNPDVLLFVDEDKVLLGKPYLSQIKVNCKILDSNVKGEKINILKYKAKSRYTKRLGFRPLYSKIEVGKISD